MNRRNLNHMANACVLLLLAGSMLVSGCGEASDDQGKAVSAPPPGMVIVEASCGQCQFGLPGDGCDLAVRIDGVGYYVDGTGIDDHGDAHAASGLCNAVRTALVSGNVEEDRFVAVSFALRPVESN